MGTEKLSLGSQTTRKMQSWMQNAGGEAKTEDIPAKI